MYFAKIESSRKASREYNDAQRALASRRLGAKQHREEKAVSMAWNVKNQWANGATKGTINRKMAARLEARMSAYQRGSSRSNGFIHQHHCPGSFQ